MRRALRSKTQSLTPQETGALDPSVCAILHHDLNFGSIPLYLPTIRIEYSPNGASASRSGSGHEGGDEMSISRRPGWRAPIGGICAALTLVAGLAWSQS